MAESDGEPSSEIKGEDTAETSTNNSIQERIRTKSFECPKCRRLFISQKAVHGHMRCHSKKKTYSEICSPRQKKSSRPIKIYSDDDDQKGLLSVTRKRRCSSVNGDEDEDELMMGAVLGFMLLSTGDERYRTLPTSYKDGIRVSPAVEKGCSSSEGKKRKRMIVISSYTCDICRLQFGTEQALGGHTMSVHKEGRRGASLDPSHHRDESSSGIVRHMCKECNKEFLTGQALGGHMRCHYIPPPPSSNIANANSMDVDGADNQDQVVIEKSQSFCLDLNEIPEDHSKEDSAK